MLLFEKSQRHATQINKFIMYNIVRKVQQKLPGNVQILFMNVK